MKILLVSSLFPPDKGVSTHRIAFFAEELGKIHEVDILKFGNNTCLDGKIKTIDKSYFSSLAKTLLNKKNIENILSPLIERYDLLIVSGPPYNIYEIANVAFNKKIKFVLDLRDQPDLIYSELKKSSSKILLKIKLYLTNYYINSIAKKSQFVSCVGGISSAITQTYFAGTDTKVINIHNGFLERDIYLVDTYRSCEVDTTKIVIGCVGSLHNFRATNDLFKTFSELENLNKPVIIRHWGILCDEILNQIKQYRNITYEKCPPIDRILLLQDLSKVDAFLLPCSDDLIWEPTTSVFDYILFSKPVIFCGLRNNEAYSILESVNQPIVTSNRIKHIDEILSRTSTRSPEEILSFSRENSFLRFKRGIDEVFDE
ncbi:MAG: hypothetical protein AB3X44_15060 [Leptothrix sp. (in: b-proteobacteria)]